MNNNEQFTIKDAGGTARQVLILGSDDTLSITNNSGGNGGPIVFGTLPDGSESLRILANGTVGIGHSAPKTTLAVTGTMSGKGLELWATSVTDTGALFVNMDGNGTGALFDSQATNAPVLALDTAASSTQVKAAPHILFGYNGTFDVRVFRTNTGSLRVQSDSGVTLTIDSEMSTATENVFEIFSDNGSAENRIWRIQADGASWADGAHTTTGADYAEWFRVSGKLEAGSGKLVCIDVENDETVKICDRQADPNVMGIVSSNPSFVGNAFWGADGIVPPGYVLVGLIGQVEAMVTDENGPIRPGDSLTPASKAGYAMRARAGDPTVGVALDGSDAGEGTVTVLIARRNSSLTVEQVEENVLQTIAAMEIEDEMQIMVDDAVDMLALDEDVAARVNEQLDAIDLRAKIEKEVARALAAQQTADQTFRSVTVSGASLFLDDLTVSGAIVAAGSRVTGDLDIGGTLRASAITVGSGSAFGGTVSITGQLILNGTPFDPSQLAFGSGAELSIGDLIVAHAFSVLGDITVEGLARFLGNVTIGGELVVNDRQAGIAMIPKTGTSVTVAFDPPFVATPVVTASANAFDPWRIRAQAATGFTLETRDPASGDITFMWHALATENPVVIEGTEGGAHAGQTLFPVDQYGVPVSSSEIWNACIRSQSPLDATGQPFNCSRYHDDVRWTHPDLMVEFRWDPEKNPKLEVPGEFEVVVVQEEEGMEGISSFAEAAEDGEGVETEKQEDAADVGGEILSPAEIPAAGTGTLPPMSPLSTGTGALMEDAEGAAQEGAGEAERVGETGETGGMPRQGSPESGSGSMNGTESTGATLLFGEQDVP